MRTEQKESTSGIKELNGKERETRHSMRILCRRFPSFRLWYTLSLLLSFRFSCSPSLLRKRFISHFLHVSLHLGSDTPTAPGGPPLDVKAEVIDGRSARISWKVRFSSRFFYSAWILYQNLSYSVSSSIVTSWERTRTSLHFDLDVSRFSSPSGPPLESSFSNFSCWVSQRCQVLWDDTRKPKYFWLFSLMLMIWHYRPPSQALGMDFSKVIMSGIK